jgi:hypothetical protein
MLLHLPAVEKFCTFPIFPCIRATMNFEQEVVNSADVSIHSQFQTARNTAQQFLNINYIYLTDKWSMLLISILAMKSSIFWDITPYSPLKVNRRFGGTCCLHLQSRRISRGSLQLTTCFHAGFLLVLFDPEDGGFMFLRNVRWFSTDYTALYRST